MPVIACAKLGITGRCVNFTSDLSVWAPWYLFQALRLAPERLRTDRSFVLEVTLLAGVAPSEVVASCVFEGLVYNSTAPLDDSSQ